MTPVTMTPIQMQDMTVSTFETHEQAERAIRRLIDAGVPAARLSIVTQGLEARKEVHGYVTTGEVAAQGAGTGAWVGGFVGLFTRGAFIWVPVIGPLVGLSRDRRKTRN